MEPITPMGSLMTPRRLAIPIISESGSDRSHSNSSIILVGQPRASSIGQSTCAAKVIMRGEPTSAMISSRYASRSDSRADCSCSRQRLRSA